MPADNNSILQASTTKTAAFDGAAFDLKTGTPRRGLFARIIYSAAATSSGGGSATFQMQDSDDGVTFAPISQARAIVLGTTAANGVLHIPFETSRRYVRLSLSAISGTGATITYESDIQLGRP